MILYKFLLSDLLRILNTTTLAITSKTDKGANPEKSIGTAILILFISK
jgi:hypothetical protein